MTTPAIYHFWNVCTFQSFPHFQIFTHFQSTHSKVRHQYAAIIVLSSVVRKHKCSDFCEWSTAMIITDYYRAKSQSYHKHAIVCAVNWVKGQTTSHKTGQFQVVTNFNGASTLAWHSWPFMTKGCHYTIHPLVLIV